MTEGDGPPEFAWDALVSQVIHPMKVAIIEAIRYVERPLSASDVRRSMEEARTVSFVAYHVKELVAMEALIQVSQRAVRGTEEKFYEIPSALLRSV